MAVEGTTGPSGGGSAGAGCAVPSGRAFLGSLPMFEGSSDISPVDSPGRIAAAYCSCPGMITGGFLALSAYLVTNEEPSSRRNVGILEALATAAIGFRGVYILQADFQCDREVLLSNEQFVGWLQRIKGVLVTPAGETEGIFSCSSGRTIDHYVLHEALMEFYVECVLLADQAAAAHRPSRLILRGCQKNPMVPVVKMPAHFPRTPPQLPARFFTPNQSMSVLSEVLSLVATDEVSLDRAYGSLCDVVEQELCQHYDCITPEQKQIIDIEGGVRSSVLFTSSMFVPYQMFMAV